MHVQVDGIIKMCFVNNKDDHGDDDDANDDDSVANGNSRILQYQFLYETCIHLDSSSEMGDNAGGGGIPPEDIVAPPQQTPVAGDGVTVDKERGLLGGNHELASTDRTIPPIDYVLLQSQLVGKESHQITHTISETTGYKHYMVTNNGSSFTLTTSEAIANLVCIYK